MANAIAAVWSSISSVAVSDVSCESQLEAYPWAWAAWFRSMASVGVADAAGGGEQPHAPSTPCSAWERVTLGYPGEYTGRFERQSGVGMHDWYGLTPA